MNLSIAPTLPLVLLLLACGGRQPTKQPHASPSRASVEPTTDLPESSGKRALPDPSSWECIADGVNLGPYNSNARRSTCQRSKSCRKLCDQGDSAACSEVAHELESDQSTNTSGAKFYAIACLLGSHNGCTNYGATTTKHQQSRDEDLVCAVRLYTLACNDGEPFGCGMLALAQTTGRGIPSNPTAGYLLATKACREVGHFSCAVAAAMQEGQGDLTAAHESLLKACKDEYPAACADAERIQSLLEQRTQPAD